MFDAYRSIFEARGDMYNAASRLVPEARAAEREVLIQRLAVERGQIVLDVPAGGGYLADGIHRSLGGAVELICVEPSEVFAEALDPGYRRIVSDMRRLPLMDATVDRAGSLAGLHHLEDPDKARTLNEMVRVLRSGGRLAVADVRTGSDVAAFLNGPVDRYCATGHDGMFLDDGFLSDTLSAAGLEAVEEAEVRYRWRFPDRETMARYCWNLFGLTEGDEGEVLAAIEDSLEVSELPDGIGMGWGLTFAWGRRPD